LRDGRAGHLLYNGGIAPTADTLTTDTLTTDTLTTDDPEGHRNDIGL